MNIMLVEHDGVVEETDLSVVISSKITLSSLKGFQKFENGPVAEVERVFVFGYWY
jgi:hypothetical protein